MALKNGNVRPLISDNRSPPYYAYVNPKLKVVVELWSKVGPPSITFPTILRLPQATLGITVHTFSGPSYPGMKKPVSHNGTVVIDRWVAYFKSDPERRVNNHPLARPGSDCISMQEVVMSSVHVNSVVFCKFSPTRSRLQSVREHNSILDHIYGRKIKCDRSICSFLACWKMDVCCCRSRSFPWCG